MDRSKNPLQCGPPQCGIDKKRIRNPPQCDPPQCGRKMENRKNPPQCGPPQCGRYRSKNPPQYGPSQCGWHRNKNPPQCGSPQCDYKQNSNNNSYAKRPLLQISKKNKWDNPTPINRKSIKPTRLFRKIQEKHLSHKERNEKFKINEDIHPVPCYYASCKFNVNKNIIISQSFNEKYK